jgi:hypothetical protein
MTDDGRIKEGPQGLKEVPVDWEALEDAFENNAPEVHSYLHLGSGEVLRVVDGIADPEMHSRIAGDATYLRIESVSSREQYRWMERFIQMVDEPPLRGALAQAIDGKGAFRRFKDVLMAHGAERERWFAFRSERLRVFMEAWLSAHALVAVARPEWRPDQTEPPVAARPLPEVETPNVRPRPSDALRRKIRDGVDALSGRDLEKVLAFVEFVGAQRSTLHEKPGDAAAASSPSGEVKELVKEDQEDSPSSTRSSDARKALVH